MERKRSYYARACTNYQFSSPLKADIYSKYVSVPEKVIKEANRIMFKFLWKGQDRVARKAMINNFENGGLNVLDFETMVKSLRLAWLRKLYTDEDAGWKRYLRFLIKPFGGHLLFHCDYEPREYNITE